MLELDELVEFDYAAVNATYLSVCERAYVRLCMCYCVRMFVCALVRRCRFGRFTLYEQSAKLRVQSHTHTYKTVEVDIV